MKEGLVMSIKIKIENSDTSDYIFIPACCYNGNQFDVLKKDYPPMFEVCEASLDTPTIITDVPRLNKDGSGKIQITTGDAATPCIGVFSKLNKKGTLVFTVQEIDGKNLGLAYANGEISITYPAERDLLYRWPHMVKNTEVQNQADVKIPYKLLEFDCESLSEFYRVFFENRKIMKLDCAHSKTPDWNAIWEIHRNKYNDMNWRESLGFYGVGTVSDKYQVWQPGWVGGAMATYALMKLGGELEYERSIRTLHHLFNSQGKSGFFYGGCDEEGKIFSDGFGVSGTENFILIRKSADVLYFLFKHFELMKEIPQSFIDGTKRLADAFVELWQRYGQLGQFVDVVTREIIVGNSCSGVIASAGLISAYKFFGDEKYLVNAKEIADYYYKNFTLKGYTTGGPGEILQGPDSESAFALLESFVEVYDATKEGKYLEMACDMANQCSSWVVSYNYKFPDSSEFGRLDMKTTGSVFANVQNKHSAPGICTLSGNSLLKLYKWTKNELYKELIDDISKNIWQYMSTDERPIYSWDKVPVKLLQGFICERVNMSDWEGYDCIGGVFNGSCWCEASSMLTIADMDFLNL